MIQALARLRGHERRGRTVQAGQAAGGGPPLRRQGRSKRSAPWRLAWRLALSCTIHVILLAALIYSRSPPPLTATAPAFDVVLVPPHQADRERAARQPKRPARPRAVHQGSAEGPPAAAEGPVGASPPASAAAAPRDMQIDDAWRVPKAAWDQEIARQALRRTQIWRVCYGMMDGVLSGAEKEACANLLENGGRRRRSGL